eukprot:s571_g12.t1
MDFIDAKAASTTSPRVAASSDFFTASSGLTEKAGNEESVKPQTEKSGLGLRLPKPKKKTPKERNKSPVTPVSQTSERSFFDAKEAVGRVSQSSEAPKFGSGFEFAAAPRLADPEQPVRQPTVSQDFFTASSGTAATDGAATLSHPQASADGKSNFTLRLPKASKKKTPPRERDKSPVSQTSERSFFDAKEAVGRVSQSSEAPKFGSGFEFAAAPRSADPELQPEVSEVQKPTGPTVSSQDFFTASSGTASDVAATLSHPQIESKSGFTLRLPKAKKKTPPREREKGRPSRSEISQSQLGTPSGSIGDLPRVEDPTGESQGSSPSKMKSKSQMVHKPRNFGVVSLGSKSDDETLAGADLDAAATKIQAVFRGKTARQLVKTKLDAVAAIGRVKLHGQESKDGAPLVQTSEAEDKDHARESMLARQWLERIWMRLLPRSKRCSWGKTARQLVKTKLDAVAAIGRVKLHGQESKGILMDSVGCIPGILRMLAPWFPCLGRWGTPFPIPTPRQDQAATRIQALWRGRQLRAKGRPLKISQVAQVGLRIKAMRHGHSPTSPISPVVQEAQKSFLETPTQSPRTQADDRAAVRLQAVFRGNRVRRQLEAQRQAATKIQAQFRGRKGRLLAMDLATVVNLRVKVHNFHKSAAAGTASSKVTVDNSFFDAGGVVSEPLPQEKAAVKIQNFYRRRRGDTRLSRNSGIADVVSSVGPAAVGAVRRSLVAAGFAVVGAGNAQIAQLFHRASATFDEALSAVGSAGDAAAQRASVALGESLLQMVDTSSPPESPKMERKSDGKNDGKKGKDDEDGSDSESDEDPKGEDEPKHWTAGDGNGDPESRPRSKKAAAREFIRCIDQSCAKLQGWLQRRQQRPPAAPLRLDLVPLVAEAPELHEDKAPVQMLLSEMPMMGGRLEKCEVAPCFYPGDSCRDCGLSGKSFKSISAELEFSLWGLCEDCQDKLFLLQTALETADVSLIAPGHPLASLSPYHTVPVVYPDDTPWISPFHLFLAHQFPDHNCQKLVHSAHLGSSVRSLMALLDQDLLRNHVREDWHHGWAVKAMRHVIFLAVEQHPRLAALLLATGNSRLICLSENFLWGMEQHGNAWRGENLIGKILEEKRDLLM